MKKFMLSGFVTGLLVASAALAEVQPIKEVFEPSGKFPKDKYVKVAVVAISPLGIAPIPATKAQATQYKETNQEALEGRIREAAEAGAEIILTPEFGVTGYPDIPELPSEEDNFRSREDIAPFIEPINGPTAKFFAELAKELKVYIHFGLATEDKKDGPYHNTVIVVGPTGKVETYYHKNALFELEHHFLEPGTAGAIYNSPAGKIGIIICSDVYSDQALRHYRSKVDVLALSTSWARYNTGMSQFTSTARSMKTYLLAANQMYFPDSGVINPDGTKQSHIRQTEANAYGYLPRVKAGKQGK